MDEMIECEHDRVKSMDEMIEYEHDRVKSMDKMIECEYDRVMSMHLVHNHRFIVIVPVVGAIAAVSSLVVSTVITDETAEGPLLTLSFVTTMLTLISVTYIHHIISVSKGNKI